MVPFRIRHADKVAAAFIAATVAVVLSVVFLVIKGQQLFATRIPYYTIFDDAGGVAPETPVKLAGIEVGKVRRVSLTDDNRVRVDFDVLEAFADRVRADPPGKRCERALRELLERCSLTVLEQEEAAQGQDGQKSCAELEQDKRLCGSRVKASLPAGLGAFLPGGGGLVLTVGNLKSERLEAGGFIPSEVEKGVGDVLKELAQQGVVQNAQDIVEQVALLLRRVNDARGPVWESLENVRVVSERVRRGEGPVGQALTTGSPLDRRLSAALGKLDEAMASVGRAAGNLDRMTGEADERIAALYRAIDNLEAFSVTARAAVDDLRLFAEGSTALPANMNATIDNIDRKVEDLGDIIRGLKQSFPLNLVVDESTRPGGAPDGGGDNERPRGETP